MFKTKSSKEVSKGDFSAVVVEKGRKEEEENVVRCLIDV